MQADSKKNSHQTCLTIDILNNKAYLIDPNGTTSYFNAIFSKISHEFHMDINPFVDKLLKDYFVELNKIGINIEFVPSSVWNKNRICINKYFNMSIFGSGHCVITTIMLGHCLTTHKLSPSELFEKFRYSTNEELLTVINSYMSGIYQLLQSLKTD
jgi:hypothetical protein